MSTAVSPAYAHMHVQAFAFMTFQYMELEQTRIGPFGHGGDIISCCEPIHHIVWGGSLQSHRRAYG